MDYRKSTLVARAYKSIQGIVKNDNEILLEINIPFCECKCIDCKKNIYLRSKTQDVYLYYIDALIKELNQAREIIKKKCYIVKAVCFKGNLLALDEKDITKLMDICRYPLSETCIELGNPKILTKEKLDIIKKYGNVRVIINALTYNTVTLRKLCRHYEAKDLVDYYKLLQSYNFDLTVNIVAGLLGEKRLQAERNITTALEYGANCINIYSRYCPDNIKEEATDIKEIADQRKTLEGVSEFMFKQGFMPYYLYCTEVDNGCFENVGYSLPGKKCKYQEDKIYEISTILGCGAETDSMIIKNITKTKKKLKNTYDLGQYVMGINEILNKKEKFFE